jgi:hypothetical protein
MWVPYRVIYGAIYRCLWCDISQNGEVSNRPKIARKTSIPIVYRVTTTVDNAIKIFMAIVYEF